MNPIAIRVEGLGKQYRIGAMPTGYRTLRDSLVSGLKRLGSGDFKHEQETIWALRDISFELMQGQVLGIIGRNGAGKSTLLKLLSRVTEPTEGYAEIHGRVGSLLEVGTGFHPELTGRENIFLNGAILGMKRTEIEAKFDEIVEFAEVRKFIDTPVKRYSSGMYLRLAFAVAAHLEPEILVVDEVLAVGDAEFQQKCLGKMSDVAREGRTVLFVSHNMSAILRLTQETLVLEKGKIVLRAPTPEAVDFYMTSNMARSGEYIWQDPVASRDGPFQPHALRVIDHQGRIADRIASTEGCRVEFEYELSRNVTGLRIGLYVNSSRGESVFTSFDTDDPSRYERFTERPAGRYISRCTIPSDLMNGGTFILGVNASTYQIHSYFTDEHVMTLTVDATGAPGSQWVEARRGSIRPALEWEIVESTG